MVNKMYVHYNLCKIWFGLFLIFIYTGNHKLYFHWWEHKSKYFNDKILPMLET